MSDWLIPQRPGEDEETARFREAMNRHAEAALKTLDGAIRLRSATGSVSRLRSIARTKLQETLLFAMQAHDLDRHDRAEAAKSAADRGSKPS
jgi:hypothetical protein